MIISYPESPMPEPYRTYVAERNRAIGQVLERVVTDQDVQLCPRAITADEAYPGALVYGAVVRSGQDGLKSALYRHGITPEGVATDSHHEARAYFAAQVRQGNRVRLKDPRESDGKGQYIAETTEQLAEYFDGVIQEAGECVIMPHVEQVEDRISVGRIRLGRHGLYHYVGREESIAYQGAQVYGGTRLGLHRAHDHEAERRILDYLEIDPRLAFLGSRALTTYDKVATVGRASVDVISGRLGNGQSIASVVDLTPRVGGTTPAEVLAIEAVRHDGRPAVATSSLQYDRTSRVPRGVVFLDTPELTIRAEVEKQL